MRNDNDLSKRWFIRNVGALTYILFGGLILVLRLGPALLGFEGSFEAEMSFAALPVLVLLWVLPIPFFVLVGHSIDVCGFPWI